MALGLPQWQRYVPMLEAMTALLDGRFEDAEQAANASEAISLAMGDTGSAWLVNIHRAMHRWTRTVPGDPRERERLLADAPAPPSAGDRVHDTRQSH